MKKQIIKMQEELKQLALVQKSNKNAHAENQRAGEQVEIILNRDGTRKGSGYWDYSQYVTVLHIVYNRMRHRPPHLGSEEKDEEYLSGENPELWGVLDAYREISQTYPAPKEEEVAV